MMVYYIFGVRRLEKINNLGLTLNEYKIYKKYKQSDSIIIEKFRKAYDDKEDLWSKIDNRKYKIYQYKDSEISSWSYNVEFGKNITKEFRNIKDENIKDITIDLLVANYELPSTLKPSTLKTLRYGDLVSGDWILYSDHLKEVREKRFKQLLDKS